MKRNSVKNKHWMSEAIKDQSADMDLQDSLYSLQAQDRIPRGIEVEENRIYIYSEVGHHEALELNRLIRRLDVEMKYLSDRLDSGKIPIHLHINSPGGSIFSGLSLVDTIERCSVPVHTYVDGSAASAATLISCSGTKGKRFISKNSFMLIHQPYMEWAGKRDEFLDEIENQEKIFKKIKELYMKNCKFKSNKELTKLLDRELWLNSERAIELGLVDRII